MGRSIQTPSNCRAVEVEGLEGRRESFLGGEFRGFWEASATTSFTVAAVELSRERLTAEGSREVRRDVEGDEVGKRKKERY